VNEEIAMNVQERIADQIKSNHIMLYMKGTPQFPQCGFSGRAVQLLQACGANEFGSVDVLSDPDVRQGIKEYSNWPTIPQLYINGEFVGGADIMTELYQNGELQKLVAAAK
jgi:monothiol glutaredoxin